MIRTITTLLIAIYSVSLNASAKSEGLRIYGKVSNDGKTVQSGNIRFYIYNIHSISKVFGHRTVECPLGKEGDFEATIPISELYVFLRMEVKINDTQKGKMIPYYSLGTYLFKKGDDVAISIDGTSVSFSGAGAYRLNCQTEIFSQVIVPPDTRLLADNNSYDYLRNLDETYAKKVAVKKHILSTYQYQLDGEEYGRILKDIQYLADWEILHTMGNFIALDPLEKNQVRKFFIEKYANVEISKEDLSQTAYGGDFQFQREITRAALDSELESPYKGFSLDTLFGTLINGYSGDLQGYLLVRFFTKFKSRLPKAKIESFFAAVEKKRGSGFYWDELARWEKRNLGHAKIFPFELETMAGEIVTPESFRGKTVVLKFWFSGCVPCIRLAERLKPVLERFKADSNVVFVSVNVDRSKKIWADALKTGKYTAESEVLVYTGGLGRDHLMLSFYGFSGFPQLLIMDGDGYVSMEGWQNLMIGEEGPQRLGDMIETLSKYGT